MSLPSKPSSLPLEEVGALLQSTLHLQGAVRPAEPAVDRLVPEPPSCVFRLSHSDQITPPPPAASSSSPQAMLSAHPADPQTLTGRSTAYGADLQTSAPPRPSRLGARPRTALCHVARSPPPDIASGRRAFRSQRQTARLQNLRHRDSSDTDSETDTDTYQNQPNSQRLAALRCDAASRTLLGLR